MKEKRLTRRFFRRDPVTLAKALLGQILVRRLDDGQELEGRIIEVEAYLGVPDRACHTYGGRRTKRNASMWLDGGHAYVYFVYGMHWCFNVVSEREEVPTACLVRALQPLKGFEEMHRRRGKKYPAKLGNAVPAECLTQGVEPPIGTTETRRCGEKRWAKELCSGPAKLTQALAIDGSLDGADLTSSESVFIRRGRKVTSSSLQVGPRVGVGYAGKWAFRQLRFWERDSRILKR